MKMAMAAGIVAAALVGLLTAVPALAINKCTGSDGKVIFQDAPCAGKGERVDVRPASGHATAPRAPASGKAQTEAQRLEALASSTQKDRRRRELEVSLVPNAFAAIDVQRKSCDRELEALRLKKASANNNLAGATWEQSISAEMAATATRCDTKARELQHVHDSLKAECTSLGGCKS